MYECNGKEYNRNKDIQTCDGYTSSSIYLPFAERF